MIQEFDSTKVENTKPLYTIVPNNDNLRKDEVIQDVDTKKKILEQGLVKGNY